MEFRIKTMTIVHGGEEAYMLERVNDFSHVNKLGIVGLEYDGTFFCGKKKKSGHLVIRNQLYHICDFLFYYFICTTHHPRQASMLA